ncbi:MAG: hypothetical protein Tsb0033_00910 [Winogradskyella sp.]
MSETYMGVLNLSDTTPTTTDNIKTMAISLKLLTMGFSEKIIAENIPLINLPKKEKSLSNKFPIALNN